MCMFLKMLEKIHLGIYECARKHVYDVLLMPYGPNIIQPGGYENPSNVVPLHNEEALGKQQ